MTAYYNEIDPYAAQWLRNLIDAGHIAPGVVDTRSIEDVTPNDPRGYTQCHFFAGIGVWSLALRRAGWPDDMPVWTGSCPCQPFSQAGEGTGFDDERHLWPAFHWLIEQCRPAVVFGEQVASRDANPWIDLVQTDLEAVGYGVGAVAFPSAGVGAPHIRDRLYWVADADEGRRGRRALDGQRKRNWAPSGWIENSGDSAGGSAVCGLEYAGQHDDAGQSTAADSGHPQAGRSTDQSGQPGVSPSGMADTCRERVRTQGPGAPGTAPQGMCGEVGQRERLRVDFGASSSSESPRPGPTNGFWRDADWLLCRDGKWRPVRPGSFPLVNGASSRVGRLRAYGNAINAEAARVFIESYLSA